jgi:transcriptional regulator GlxA family with amidase domain
MMPEREDSGDSITVAEEFHALERLTNLLYLIERHAGDPTFARNYAAVAAVSVRLLTRALHQRLGSKRDGKPN